MKKHFVIFVIIFLATVGYAAANTVLDITGIINVAENIEDFKIEITNLKINNNDSKTLISKDKQSFTFTGSGNDTINYTVTNYSYQYDANISLICTPSENITVEQISNLPAQSKNSKGITSTNTSEITCTINVEKISRTDYAEDMCKYAEGTEWTFDYTGAEQEFTTPCDGNYKVELWGAGSGDNNLSNHPTYGGYSSGVLHLNGREKIYVHVGGRGTKATTLNGTTGAGYNGGGAGGYYSSYDYTYGGGGATDIRLFSGTWNNFIGLKSRIIIAGGGAGSDYSAGGLISYGYEPLYPAATQTSGYAFGYGCYKQTNESLAGFGSGGGYYGGHCNTGGCNGAGGSSFISGHNGCDAIAENSTSSNIIHTGQPNHYSGLVFTDTVMIDGAGYNWTNVKGEQTGMPTHDGKSTMTGNAGNGYAKITYLGK